MLDIRLTNNSTALVRRFPKGILVAALGEEVEQAVDVADGLFREVERDVQRRPQWASGSGRIWNFTRFPGSTGPPSTCQAASAP